MQQFAFHFMPDKAQSAVYALKCRSNHNLLSVKDKIIEAIEEFKKLRFTEEEIVFLKETGLFKDTYLDFLRSFNFDRSSVLIEEVNGNLSIRVVGPWRESILFEVPVLAIVQEIYFKELYNEEESQIIMDEARNRLNEKIVKLKGTSLRLADFGTRRRFSFDWHKEVVLTLKNNAPMNLIGTSNVLIAKELGIPPLGTMAHEFFSAMQGLDFIPIELSQKYALEMWHKEYDGKLDIALTDIFNIDSFLHDCDYSILQKYDGFRHDSGCPFSWGERIINHCIGYGVNPLNKKLIFSDNLNIDKAIALLEHFSKRINVSFGIGTNLTNDFNSHLPMSLVMKMVRFNDKPVIKVSDEPAKLSCEDPTLTEYVLKYLKNIKNKENTYPVINSCVDIILIHPEGSKVLLIERGDSSEAEFKKYALPGGYLDINETAVSAIKREVHEELGMVLDEGSIVFREYRDALDRDPRRRTVSLVFTAKLNISNLIELKENEEEVLSIKFLEKENIDALTFAFDHKDILKDFLDE